MPLPRSPRARGAALSTPVEEDVEYGESPAKWATFAHRSTSLSGRGHAVMLAVLVPERGDGAGVVARQQELTAESLWTEVAGRLRTALNDTTFGTWFADVSSRDLTDESFVLSVPNDFTRQWIEGHFIELIAAAVRDASGDERRVRLVVEQEVEPAGPMGEPPQPTRTGFELNQKYTFDSFVI